MPLWFFLFFYCLCTPNFTPKRTSPSSKGPRTRTNWFVGRPSWGIALGGDRSQQPGRRGSPHAAAKDAGLKLVVGAEITPDDAPPVVLWATDRAAYGRLARLITQGRRRAEKGDCRLCFDDIAQHAEGLLAGMRGRGESGEGREKCKTRCWFRSQSLEPALPLPSPLSLSTLHSYRDLFADRCYLLAELHRGPDDRRKLARLQEISRQTHIPLVAAGDVHYHVAERRRCTTY